MRLFWFGLRLLAIGILFSLMGCGPGDEISSGDGLYTLKFNFANSSGATVRFNGKDVTSSVDADTNVDTGASGNGTTSALYKTSSVNIDVSVFNAAGTMIVHKEVNGVHAANNKTTYIYVTFNGTTLGVDATRLPGVSR